MQLRVRAEEQYRKSQAVLKISKAMNSQTRPYQVFIPGDLVYYRRYKTPNTSSVSLPGVDNPKMGLARWYGPARVLATETRAEVDPATRKPGSVVWIISAGRLKRCSPVQLRHCSEREKFLAEKSEAVTMPWSFNSLMHLLERGQYRKFDDLEEDEDRPEQRMREDRRSQSRVRARSRSLPPQRNVKDPTTTAKTVECKGQAESSNVGERRPGVGREGAPDKKETDRQRQPKRAVSAGATAMDSQPSVLDSNRLFQQARQRAQREEQQPKLWSVFRT